MVIFNIFSEIWDTSTFMYHLYRLLYASFTNILNTLMYHLATLVFLFAADMMTSQ